MLQFCEIYRQEIWKIEKALHTKQLAKWAWNLGGILGKAEGQRGQTEPWGQTRAAVHTPIFPD